MYLGQNSYGTFPEELSVNIGKSWDTSFQRKNKRNLNMIL